MITYEFRCLVCGEKSSFEYKTIKQAESEKQLAYCKSCESKKVKKIISQTNNKHSSWSKW